MTARGPAQGFTLLEVLVVLAVMALLSAVAAGLYPRLSPGFEARQAVRELAAALRHARSQAVSDYREVRLMVDVGEGSFRIGDAGRPRPLPKAFGITLEAAESERVGEQAGGIRFFPDGSSTGGRIRLEADGAAYAVMVDWFTGNVSIVE